ncbi:Pentatricopeptide repeat-containing protein [Actinidia chinensis var. chinensis]|uniref:Pentatricopeptide repeat-containing protein n=1 Tax=Actinidia chinensis var. chinensis TaxID=1590841 RepID=A0A2R6PQA3_ACTCC|nr:Pentatricopeptide repeat-containing protein [Actinidia chinensis var. chinensis]
MISRKTVSYILKTQQSLLQSPFLHPSLIPQSTRSINSHSLLSQYSDYPISLTQKDWLSPIELVKIFQSLKDPNSTLTLLSQASNRKDFKPTESLYTVIIAKLALANNFDGIEQLMETIKAQKNCRFSENFFYNVIKIYGNFAGRINRAIETLFDMPKYGCWPTGKTFNFVLNLLASTKQFDVVHEVYVSGAKLGIEIDACCLNIMIKGLCGCGDLDGAHQVLDEFPKQGCRPNVRTYSTLMHALCERGQVGEAFGLFERMEREGIEPDAITFNIQISGLRKQGRVEEGIEILHKMRRKGCDPNPGTYQEVLYGLLGAKKFVEAKGFMGRMILEGLSPSFNSYKLIIQGLCDQNLVEDVDWVLRQMVRHGFVPKMGMWRRILRCTFSGTGYTGFSLVEILEN